MSTYQSNIVWRKIDVQGAEKVLLLALADISNDDGDNIHPSNDYLVWMTGMPLRTVQFYKAKWKRIGALVAIGNQQGGSGNFVSYHLDLSKFPAKEPWKAKQIKGATIASLRVQPLHPSVEEKGCNGAQEKGAMVALKGARESTKGCKEAQPHKEEPLEEPQGTMSGTKRPALSQAERDSWDLRRWQEAMQRSEPQVGAHIADPDAHWRDRARRAAFEAGVSPDRIVSLLRAHFPHDANIELLYDQGPLFKGQSA